MYNGVFSGLNHRLAHHMVEVLDSAYGDFKVESSFTRLWDIVCKRRIMLTEVSDDFTSGISGFVTCEGERYRLMINFETQPVDLMTAFDKVMLSYGYEQGMLLPGGIVIGT